MARSLFILPLVLLLSVGCQSSGDSTRPKDPISSNRRSTASRQKKRYSALPRIPAQIPKTQAGDDDPRKRDDQIAQRYSEYDYGVVFEQYKELYEDERSAELARAFDPIRAEPGWNEFVNALSIGDNSVNSLAEQNIVSWDGAGPLITQVTNARNAWRRAATFGIMPPDLPLGFYRFAERGITFILHVRSEKEAALIARSPRGRVIGVFELALWAEGRRHMVSHMLQRPFRYPDVFLNYPWNVIMATDTIYVDDVHVILDRIEKEVTVLSTGTRARRKAEISGLQAEALIDELRKRLEN